MLWVTCCSDGTRPFRGIYHNPSKVVTPTIAAAKVAIRSARENTSLDIAVMYDGDSPEFLAFLKSHDVRCIQQRFSYADDPTFWPGNHDAFTAQWCCGAWMRTDIPSVFPEQEYVLYTDPDVVFNRDPAPLLEQVAPKIVAGVSYGKESKFPSVSGKGFINTGVLVINVKAWTKEFDAFIDTARKANWGETINFDEGVINRHFKGRIEFLRRTFNWRPWWGVFEAAPIVHYHGAKIKDLIEYTEWGIESPDLPGYCAGLWRVGGGGSPFAVDMTRDIARHYVDLYARYNY